MSWNIVSGIFKLITMMEAIVTTVIMLGIKIRFPEISHVAKMISNKPHQSSKKVSFTLLRKIFGKNVTQSEGCKKAEIAAYIKERAKLARNITDIVLRRLIVIINGTLLGPRIQLLPRGLTCSKNVLKYGDNYMKSI